MPAHPDVVAYPMAATGAQMQALDAALAQWERAAGISPGATEILPVCETALGVVDVRAIAAGSARIRAALLGVEDLSADLRPERSPDALEIDHARRRFVLESRAAGIEPIDAPYTFGDADGAVREARYAHRLGYQYKALVRPEHAQPLNAALTPSEEALGRAMATVAAVEAARDRGEDRTLVDGLWVAGAKSVGLPGNRVGQVGRSHVLGRGIDQVTHQVLRRAPRAHIIRDVCV